MAGVGAIRLSSAQARLAAASGLASFSWAVEVGAHSRMDVQGGLPGMGIRQAAAGTARVR